MKRFLSGLVAALAAIGMIGVGTSWAGSAGSAGEPYAPADDTIVEVTGDAANGFGIHRYDGSWIYPPTDSEARAECNEYDTRVARVRCRTQVRTWYRDLADLQQSLRWAAAQ